MVLTIASDPVPLRAEDNGAVYVANTRVTLGLVILAYLNGSSAEEIAGDFDTLDLGDVYAVLGYYLHHKDEVNSYLEERRRYADEVRAKIEARQGSQDGLRERLLARLTDKEC
ncbi:MAG TPA: DUF433 domain-containing protein [Chloroflexia bacterium]|nr:DUF433 domain-containing protein [Chloroflexia bacterium]